MFRVYGSGQKGLKTDDLEQYAEMIISLGMEVPEGLVILTDTFLQAMETMGLTEESSPEELENADCPECLLEINDEVLDELEVGVAYAIRSSALSERGGTGIYHTSFFVPSGRRDDDLQEFWEKEREVYASEFTSDAKAWRKKNKAQIGMAILIQAVEGFRMEEYFLPLLSGVAYTSYQGLPTVRVVIGLGTKAVVGGGAIYNLPPSEHLYLQRRLWEQERAEAIDLSTGKLAEIDAHYEEIHCGMNFQAFCDLFDKLTELKQHGDFSLEWVITEDGITIVQCAPYEDRLPGDMSIDKDRYFLLAQGVDVFNSGRACCDSVICVEHWSRETADILEGLNEKKKDFLLIVPQDAFSKLSGIGRFEKERLPNKRIGLCHFSNALALVEEQYRYSQEQHHRAMEMGQSMADHSGEGLGATHFQQLCTRSDILFVGAEFDLTSMLTIPGRVEYDHGILIWETSAIILVDGVNKEGYVYIAKQD